MPSPTLRTEASVARIFEGFDFAFSTRPRGILGLAAEICAGRREDVAKHLWRQHAGARVVARAVIADENPQPTDIVRCAMTERRGRAAVVERRHGALMGNPAERHDGAEILHLGDGRFEKSAAGLDLCGRGLVLRRSAAYRVGDTGIHESEIILPRRPITAARKAEVLERVVEQLACEIAGERPSGAVCSPQSGGEAHDEEARARRTERGDRCVEPSRLAAAPLLPEFLEARTKRTVAAGFTGRVGHRGALSPRDRRR